MNVSLSRIVGGVTALGAAALLAALSRAPLAAYPDDAPVLRLAWSVRPERIEHCRTLTDVELADVPAHMRQRVQCEGRSANYRLRVAVDGVGRLDTLVTGGGVRGDRPVYVFRELPLPAGEHQLAVDFEREALPGEAGRDADSTEETAAPADTLMAARATRETEERIRRHEEAVPPAMSFAAAVNPGAREVLLVTYDVDRRTLVLRTRSPAP